MAEVIASNNLFKVWEFQNGYQIEHIPTGKTHWMSDGVGMFHWKNGSIISPGSPAFNKAMQDWIDREKGLTMEAYFPEVEDEKYDATVFRDRLGCINIWPGRVTVVMTSPPKAPYDGVPSAAPIFIQAEEGVNELLNSLGKKQRREIENGYATTAKVSGVYFGSGYIR